METKWTDLNYTANYHRYDDGSNTEPSEEKIRHLKENGTVSSTYHIRYGKFGTVFAIL